MVETKLIYPYYDNPEMLALQVENWNRIAGELRQAVRIVLVDDCSKQPALPIFKECKAPKTLLRFTEPGLWTMHEARNLGAFQCSKDDPWLFMSDIDIIATPETLYTLLTSRLDSSKHYTFERAFAPDLTRRKVHCNTFLVKRSAYTRINGYDVDFCGLYGGGYGGDGEFIRQLSVVARPQHRKDIVLIGHERDTVRDANTTQWDRDEWKVKYRAVFDAKRKTGDMRSVKPVRRPWEKLL
jgi:hypothetical protein